MAAVSFWTERACEIHSWKNIRMLFLSSLHLFNFFLLTYNFSSRLLWSPPFSWPFTCFHLKWFFSHNLIVISLISNIIRPRWLTSRAWSPWWWMGSPASSVSQLAPRFCSPAPRFCSPAQDSDELSSSSDTADSDSAWAPPDKKITVSQELFWKKLGQSGAKLKLSQAQS